MTALCRDEALEGPRRGWCRRRRCHGSGGRTGRSQTAGLHGRRRAFAPPDPLQRGVPCRRSRGHQRRRCSVAQEPAPLSLVAEAVASAVVTLMALALDDAVELTRTGDLWLFRGRSVA